MKAITFLGARDAYLTTYVLPDGREHTAPYFGAALARFYPDLSMRVFVTEEARKRHLDPFKVLVEDYVADLEPVDIPDGNDESQMWGIFQAVVDEVNHTEAVLFDITHGFRSLPFLAFLAAAYLRTVKKVTIEGVLYGNFEARNQTVTPNRAPVVDLTSFVGLLDWMVAADRFVRFGDAQDLAGLLEQRMPSSHDAKTQPELRPLKQNLRETAGALRAVSRSLRLIRPYETMTNSYSLENRLPAVIAELQKHVRPLEPLSQQILDAYAPIALDKQLQAKDPAAVLQRERELVLWYLERRQYVQAVAVAREWLVSWAMLQIEELDFLDSDTRQIVERAIARHMRAKRQSANKPVEVMEERQAQMTERIDALSQIEELANQYDTLGQLRNDLLHAGKNKNARSASSLDNDIPGIVERLKLFLLPGDTELL